MDDECYVNHYLHIVILFQQQKKIPTCREKYKNCYFILQVIFRVNKKQNQHTQSTLHQNKKEFN